MYTEKQRIPYTYSIKFLVTGQYYYGVKYSEGCKPTDLGSKYLSSSKVVLALIKEHGIEEFEFTVRKIFNSADEAKAHETKFLKRVNARANPKFLNKHNNDSFYPLDNSGEKNPMFGKPAPNRGKKHKPETIEKMLASHQANPTWLGKHLSEEHKNKIAKGQQGSKHRRFKGIYHTPYGVFESSRLAEHPMVSYKAVQKWCQNSEKKISLKAIMQSPYLNEEHLGKTFKEIGFWFETT